MTDSTTDGPTGSEQPRSDDDVVSAMLDGEATPDDVARVESSPALQRRLESLRSVRNQLATVPPAPPALVDAHIAAALDEFSEIAGGGAGAADGPVPLAEIRRAWWQRVPLGAVAAAAAVVVLAGILGLTAGRDGDDTATSAFDSAAGTVAADADDAGGAAAGALPTDDSLAETMTSPAPATESAMADDAAAAPPPEFSSTDDLAAYLRDALSERGGTSTTVRGQPSDGADAAVPAVPDPCGAVALLDLDPAAVRLVVSAVVDGSPVTAVVHDSEDRLLLTVLDDSSCRVVLERPL